MATTGSERGLTLRCPGRFTAAADRLRRAVPRAATGRRRRPAARRGSSRRGWTPRPTGCSRCATVTEMVDGRPLGRASRASTRCSGPSSTSRLHETALDLLGPLAELTAKPGAVDAGAWMKGYQFALVGPDLRRHQRDPAQHRRRARARPAEEVSRRCASPSPTTRLLFRDAVRELLDQRVPARGSARGVGRRSGTADGRAARCGPHLAEMGVVGLTGARALRRARPDRARPSNT